MKRLKIGLLARIIIAIALGIGFGNVLPGELVRVFVTFNGIFSEFLGFIIPLIILGLVTPAIADIGKEAGKDAGNHNVGGIRRHFVLRIPVLFHRSDFIPFHDCSGSADRTNQ